MQYSFAQQTKKTVEAVSKNGSSSFNVFGVRNDAGELVYCGIYWRCAKFARENQMRMCMYGPRTVEEAEKCPRYTLEP